MKKIIVAGAGHGGISAAVNLAKNGYEVDVYEKHSEEEMGYDWHDTMTLPIFEQAGFPQPAEDQYLPVPALRYLPPCKGTVLSDGEKWAKGLITIDRKVLYRHLISYAKENGVRFHFGTTVRCAAFEKEKIVGIKVTDGEGDKILRGDLVIDACGMNSPVRKSLRQCCGIRNCFTVEETFYVYRAYYENTSGEETEETYNVYLFHCGNPGMDWVITNPGFIDVLVGSFGPLTQEMADKAVEDFRKDYPMMGKRIRGGQFAKIPLANPLSKFVCDHYAAVGDSASMTEPMSGSGINMSLYAGKVLADTVIAAGEKELTADVLWKYQYDYLKTYGERFYGDTNLRKMLEGVTAKVIDDLVMGDVVTAKEIKNGGVKIGSLSELLTKAVGIMPHPELLPGFVTMAKKNAMLAEIKESLPAEYDEKALAAWRKKYDTL